MKYRFQKAQYECFVKALDLGFRYNSLFAMRSDGTIDYPIIRFGGLQIKRVNTDMYDHQCDRLSIKTLLGYGYIFFRDELFFRPKF